MRPRLMTSNLGKIAEFARLGIDADIGGPAPDLREAMADPGFIAAHKAFSCGPGSLCEDTRLDIQGAEVGAMVKFALDELPSLDGRRARFACCLALAFEGEVLVWEGAVEGRIGAARGQGGFGFDPLFQPDGAGGLSLAELAAVGRKDEFSARARACALFKAEPAARRFASSELAAFDGPWQGDARARAKIGP